jgi:diacylglycerol O-acyltransferase
VQTLGRRLLQSYPFVPVVGSIRIVVAIFSYDGGLYFGVTGDYDGARDIDVLTGGIERGMQDLLAIAEPPGSTQASASARSTQANANGNAPARAKAKANGSRRAKAPRKEKVAAREKAASAKARADGELRASAAKR